MAAAFGIIRNLSPAYTLSRKTLYLFPPKAIAF